VISIFSALIWFPVSLYLFIIPYRLYMKQDDRACVFYVLTAIVAPFFLIWSIADFADANGWIMLASNASAGRGAAAFFSFFSAFFSTIIFLLALYNGFRFCTREHD
jgi:hypothetical protein